MTALRPGEENPEEFAQRFAAWAASGQYRPVSFASPLYEFSSGETVIFVFDRIPEFAPPGPAKVVIHAWAEEVLAASEPPGLTDLGGGRWRIAGQVEAILEAPYWVLAAGIPVLIGGKPPAAVGQKLVVLSEPPLMGFRL